jgi:hypothetical protein
VARKPEANAVLIKTLDSGVVHAGVEPGHRQLTWCGTLNDDGQSRIHVYETMADLDAILANPEALRESIASLERATAESGQESAKLAAEADRLRQQSEQKRREAAANAEMINALRFRLELLTGETPAPAADPPPAPPAPPAPAPTPDAPRARAPRRPRGEGTAGDEVLQAVNEIAVPVKIGDVHVLLPHLARKTVGWWLWKLATDRQLQRLKQGVYAPLAYRPDELTPAAPVAGDADAKASP